MLNSTALLSGPLLLSSVSRDSPTCRQRVAAYDNSALHFPPAAQYSHLESLLIPKAGNTLDCLHQPLGLDLGSGLEVSQMKPLHKQFVLE